MRRDLGRRSLRRSGLLVRAWWAIGLATERAGLAGTTVWCRAGAELPWSVRRLTESTGLLTAGMAGLLAEARRLVAEAAGLVAETIGGRRELSGTRAVGLIDLGRPLLTGAELVRTAGRRPRTELAGWAEWSLLSGVPRPALVRR
ncbi:hypothetical protein [Actinoalloteichus hymeniacidonis]|uniref:hypothetical protein n=1 Tax=Actinoalloteichus hymeniacidonis TaxID=340345 RepID=UPI0008532DA1|nr:hypothetical protein [Actinoalloteichus hymeniacidonis]MBB5910293.1 hypothetical protein [Actinoalloteichus hymeniacidonis]